MANGAAAVDDWIKAVRSAGREIPAPGEPASGNMLIWDSLAEVVL
jgi:hypothetical protein